MLGHDWLRIEGKVVHVLVLAKHVSVENYKFVARWSVGCFRILPVPLKSARD